MVMRLVGGDGVGGAFVLSVSCLVSFRVNPWRAFSASRSPECLTPDLVEGPTQKRDFECGCAECRGSESERNTFGASRTTRSKATEGREKREASAGGSSVAANSPTPTALRHPLKALRGSLLSCLTPFDCVALAECCMTADLVEGPQKRDLNVHVQPAARSKKNWCQQQRASTRTHAVALALD